MHSSKEFVRLQVLLCAAALALAGCAADRDAHYSGAGSDPAARTQSSGARALTGQDLHAPLAAGDAQFLRQAAQSGRAETRIGQVAAQRAQDPEVKAFAQSQIPRLEEHLIQAHRLVQGMGGTAGSEGAESE